MARPRKYYVMFLTGRAYIIEGSIAARKIYASGGFKTRLEAEEAACWVDYDHTRYTYVPHRNAQLEPVRTSYYRAGDRAPFLVY